MTRVLLTRPHAASQRFTNQLQRAFDPIEILISPVIEIEHLPVTIDFANFDALVLTSANAVARLRGPIELPAYCVGDRTANAAERLGMTAITSHGTVRDLIRLITAKPRGRLLYLRGAQVAGDLDARVDVTSVVTYRQIPVGLSSAAREWLSASRPVIIPLFSPLSAKGLLDQMEPRMTAPRRMVCISDAVAAVCDDAGITDVTIANATTSDAMIEAVGRVTFA